MHFVIMLDRDWYYRINNRMIIVSAQNILDNILHMVRSRKRFQ